MALSIEYRKKISESLPRGAKSAIAKSWVSNGKTFLTGFSMVEILE